MLNQSDSSARRSWRKFLFPEKERALPGERWLRTGLRTAHLAAVAVLVGGHFFNVPVQQLYGPLACAAGTGVLLVILELCGTFDWLFQIRGLVTFAKILLVLLVPVFWEQRIWILMVVLIIASISSHMPGSARYYSILKREKGELKRG